MRNREVFNETGLQKNYYTIRVANMDDDPDIDPINDKPINPIPIPIYPPIHVDATSVNTINVGISDSNSGIMLSTHKLPQDFINSKNKQITILNFEAYFDDVDANGNPSLRRSNITELHSNIGRQMNFDNHFICLSGRGFCGNLKYDVSSLSLKELTFHYYNKKQPVEYPSYIVIQLLLESI